MRVKSVRSRETVNLVKKIDEEQPRKGRHLASSSARHVSTCAQSQLWASASVDTTYKHSGRAGSSFVFPSRESTDTRKW